MYHITFLSIQSLPPLCEFIEYVDHEQSPEDLAEVQRVAQEARARWRASEVFDNIMERSNQALWEEDKLQRKYEAAHRQSEEETRMRLEQRRSERKARETERESL